MIKQFKKLTNEDRDLLYKAPVLISVLAACSFNEIDATKKRDAIKLAHLKTFTAVPLLLFYYAEVEKHFEKQFEATVKRYMPFNEAQKDSLKKGIGKIYCIIDRLDEEFAQALRKSLEGYEKHVKNSAHNIFLDFVFPIHIPGLNV